MHGWYLSRFPLSGKVLCTLYLVGIGAGAIAALTQTSTAVGLSPADVRASLEPDMPLTAVGTGQMSGEREVNLDEISDAARVRIGTPLLIQTSHTHLFGQTLIAGLLGLIFLFSSLGDGVKSAILALPFLGTLIDIGGMWMTKFVWPQFAVLVVTGGTLFALGYVLIAGISLYELWVRKEI